MTFISYAQNYEDVMLWRALKCVNNGFYIDVGAAWPDEHSVTKHFYDHGWHGINVEPNPQFFHRYAKERRRDISLSVALSDAPGQAEMYFVPNTGLSSLSKGIAEGHVGSGFEVERVNVPIQTLLQVCEQYVLDKEIHFLKVDVEGLEENVLKGNDWSRFRPWIVLVEATLPLSQEESYSAWERLLLDANYCFVYADGLNRFYVANERQDLKSAFKYPPNVFDNFVTKNEYLAQANLAKAEAANAAARHAEAKLHSVLVSRSWRITAPLRWFGTRMRGLRNGGFVSLLKILNPMQLIKFTLRRVASLVLRSPRLVYFIKPVLKKNPVIWSHIMRVVFYANDVKGSSDFESVQINDVKVFFDRSPLRDQRGIGRVTRELLNGLQRYEAEMQNNHSVGAEPKKSVFFYSSVHWCPKRLDDNSIVMIHDVIPLRLPELFDNVVDQWRNEYAGIARQARMIVTISESSALDIAGLLNVSKDKIRIVYNGTPRLPVDESVSVALPSSKFIAYVGSFDKHKNISVVLEAMTRPELAEISLVMIGDNFACRHLVKNLGIESRVFFMGRLNDAEIAHVLLRALALVFPSLYEGFGLPPLEAALLGTPSICSRRPAMTELLDGAALFAEPDNPAEWAKVIMALSNDQTMRDRIGLKAKEVAEQFTWQRSVSRLVAAIEECAENCEQSEV